MVVSCTRCSVRKELWWLPPHPWTKFPATLKKCYITNFQNIRSIELDNLQSSLYLWKGTDLAVANSQGSRRTHIQTHWCLHFLASFIVSPAFLCALCMHFCFLLARMRREGTDWVSLCLPRHHWPSKTQRPPCPIVMGKLKTP